MYVCMYACMHACIAIVESNAFVRPDRRCMHACMSVCVESNVNVRRHLRQPLPTAAAANNLQQSLSVFRDAAHALGYRLVAFTQNCILLRQDLADAVAFPRSINRLYLDALLVNWNDMLLNVEATRRGMPPDLVEAETRQFGAFDPAIDFDALLQRARHEEEAGEDGVSGSSTTARADAR